MQWPGTGPNAGKPPINIFMSSGGKDKLSEDDSLDWEVTDLLSARDTNKDGQSVRPIDDDAISNKQPLFPRTPGRKIENKQAMI